MEILNFGYLFKNNLYKKLRRFFFILKKNLPQKTVLIIFNL